MEVTGTAERRAEALQEEKDAQREKIQGAHWRGPALHGDGRATAEDEEADEEACGKCCKETKGLTRNRSQLSAELSKQTTECSKMEAEQGERRGTEEEEAKEESWRMLSTCPCWENRAKEKEEIKESGESEVQEGLKGLRGGAQELGEGGPGDREGPAPGTKGRGHSADRPSLMEGKAQRHTYKG